MKQHLRTPLRAGFALRTLGAIAIAACFLPSALEAFPRQVLVDNHEPGFSASANWIVDRAPDQFGPDYRWRPTEAISDPASWTADLPAGGAWRIDVWWPTVDGAATSVPYLVSHAGKTSVVWRDQSIGGGKWNTLGVFTFGDNESARVRLTPWGDSGEVVLADAIRWVKVPPTVIVDNQDPGFSASANWGVGQAADQYGSDYRWRITEPVSDPASWTGNLPSSGTWRVDAWWPTVSGTTTAAYIVYHDVGATTVMVDQTVNGGKWNTLGTFSFGSGGQQVLLSPWGDGGIVLADAIRWVKQ